MLVGEVWVPKSFNGFFRLFNLLFASFDSLVPIRLPLDLDRDLDLEVHLWSILDVNGLDRAKSPVGWWLLPRLCLLSRFKESRGSSL